MVEYQFALEAYSQLRETTDPTTLHEFILKLLEDIKGLQEERLALQEVLIYEFAVQRNFRDAK
jgi:hypothetical protein